MAFAYLLPRADVHRIRDMPSVVGVSEATARRRVDELAEMGLARRRNGTFTVNHDAICQPIEVLDVMRPSLLALGRARRFGWGGRGGNAGIALARRHLPPGSFVTLDYPLARLTGYGPPRDYCACVDDPDAYASLLERSGLCEDEEGRVVVMPKIGRFDNKRVRLFLDCLAAGGRLYGGAVVLCVLYGDTLAMRAVIDSAALLEALDRYPSLADLVAPEPDVSGMEPVPMEVRSRRRVRAAPPPPGVRAGRTRTRRTEARPDAIRGSEDAIAFARRLPRAVIHRIRDMPSAAGVSEATARRRVDELAGMGLADHWNGSFTVRHDVVRHPIEVLAAMRPSLLALGRARRFSRRKNNADVAFARKHLPPGSFVTLDYPLARLTGYQSAWWYYACVDDPVAFASLLEDDGFSEDRMGRVVVAPKIGAFDNEKERLLLDCLADGGRSYCDAIALLLSQAGAPPAGAVFAGVDVNDVMRHFACARHMGPARR